MSILRAIEVKNYFSKCQSLCKHILSNGKEISFNQPVLHRSHNHKGGRGIPTEMGVPAGHKMKV